MARISIAGAGSVGCYVGGCLAAAGNDVAFLARESIAAELVEHGLALSHYDGSVRRVDPERIVATVQPEEALAGAELVLVTVKSHATDEMAEIVRELAPAGSTVASLQNGVTNRAALARVLTAHRVLSVMVPFNVVHRGSGRFHCATEGRLVVQDDQELARLLDVPGVGAHAHRDIDGVLWGKLILNLNNALNALAGVPLKQQLSDRRWRRITAAMMTEALATLRAAGITPRRSGKVIPRLAPHILRLPDALFTRVAASMVQIDDQATSSMAQDLSRRRSTEVDYLQGEVVTLARAHGVAVPINERVRDLVQAAERAAAGSPCLSPDDVVQPLRL